MSKTLLVSYTPRTNSYTKELVEEFINLSVGKTSITHLDLVKTPPDLLLEENLNLIMKWNSSDRDFTEEESAILLNHHNILDESFLF